jgi:uncharacterized membrane protein
MVRNAFWVAALGIITAYLFFFALGAFDFGEVLPLSLVVAGLAVAWGIHLWLGSRRRSDTRDPRLVQARERRGF